MQPPVPSQSVFGRWFAQFSVKEQVGVEKVQPVCAPHGLAAVNVSQSAGAPAQ